MFQLGNKQHILSIWVHGQLHITSTCCKNVQSYLSLFDRTDSYWIIMYTSAPLIKIQMFVFFAGRLGIFLYIYIYISVTNIYKSWLITSEGAWQQIATDRKCMKRPPHYICHLQISSTIYCTTITMRVWAVPLITVFRVVFAQATKWTRSYLGYV